MKTKEEIVNFYMTNAKEIYALYERDSDSEAELGVGFAEEIPYFSVDDFVNKLEIFLNLTVDACFNGGDVNLAYNNCLEHMSYDTCSLFHEWCDEFQTYNGEELKEGPTRNDPEMLSKWYSVYKKKKGKHSLEDFDKHLAKFFQLTLDSHVYGIIINDGTEEGLSREKTWGKWEKYIGSKKEANLYFKAIDEVTPYT